MRSRAAVLPFPGDPFLLHYWLENFNRLWRNDIDRLYIIFNSPIENKVVDYIKFLCAKDNKIDLTYIDHHIQHGDAIRVGLEKATEDYIMLVEDDAYMIQSGKVNNCFELLESGQFDLVGSKRASCHDEILHAAQIRFGIGFDGGVGDQGPNFWPNFVFTKRQTLLATDRDFNSRAWVHSEIIALLNNYAVEAPVVSSDTFVWASIQLRSMIPEARICYVNQYHAHPDDQKHYENSYNIFDGHAPWLHIGSLSSGVSGVIMDDQCRSISKRTHQAPNGPTILPNYCNTEMEKMEFERRVQFWLTFWETRDRDHIQEFAALYKFGLDQIISQYHLQIKRIRQRQAIYKTLGL